MSGTFIQLPPSGGSPYWGDGVADFASLPATGVVIGEVVQTIDTGNFYRWTGSMWQLIVVAGADVVGPASSTDNAVVRFDGTTGKLIQNSVVIIGDTGNVTGIVDLTATGTTTLATSLSGPLRAASGVVSTGNINLATEVTNTLGINHGGTNSATALNNNRVIISSGGAIVETSAITASRALQSDTNGIPVASSVTSTELGYVSGVTSSIQAQLDARPVPQAPTVNCWVYVSQQGNDTTGDGTYDKPFATTAKAQSIIVDASTSKRYGIHIRGTITETNIYLAPYTWYYGDTWGCSRLNASGGNITLDPTKYTSGNSRSGMTNVYLTGSTGINLDFVSVSASGSHVVEMCNIGINGSVTINPNNTNQYFQWTDGALIFGDFTCHGALGLIFGVFVLGNFTVDQMATPQATGGLNLQNCFVGGNLALSTSGSFANPLQLTASTISGTTTITGAGATLFVDAVSLPLKASVTNTGGTLTRTSDVFALGYAPTTPGNWTSVPTTGQEGLDNLASEKVAKAGDTMTGGLTITGATTFLKLPSLTTTQRDALTASNGMLIYNSTLDRFQGYENGAWVSLRGWGDPT